MPEIDAVIHLAGKAHDTRNKSAADVYFKVNTGLTQKIFDWYMASPTAKKFVFFSTAKAAAECVPEILREDVTPTPKGPYGESKIKAEDYILFDSIIPEVQSGKADFAAAGMTVTEDRQTQVDFSDTYATGVQSVIVTEDSDIASLDDLKGKQIGVQQGTTGDLYSTDDFGEESVQRFSKGADAVQALSTGKIDAVIIDNKPAQVFVDENEGLKLLETPYAEEEYAIAVKKGNTELLDAINASIANLKESGKLDEIVAKYITAE